MFYEKKVKYLDYLVRQERCGNAGFLKLEARDNTCNITINVSNLRATDSLSAKVHLIGVGKERELCSLDLVQGRGRKQLSGQDMHNIGNTGISYADLAAVRILISAEREIYGIVGEKRTDAEEVMEGVAEIDNFEQNEAVNVAECGAANMTECEVVNMPECETVKAAGCEMIAESVTDEEKKDICEDMQEETRFSVPLHDDKWKQLWEIYPHIFPFRDEREYLTLGPNDFVILPWKYFRMANNSFLLHGYYNYKHLILKRMEYHGEVRYYIGVPGNFYEREKQVAVMFGFESFESLEEPASTGDYGYYLMRIEL